MYRKGRLTLKHPLHPLFPASTQPKQRRPSHTHAPRAQTQRLDHVRPALDPAINPHLDPVKHLWAVLADLEQRVDRRGRGVERPAAVVGEDNRFDLRRVAGSEVRVFMGLDALEDDGFVCVLGEPGECGTPREVCGGAPEEGLPHAGELGGFGGGRGFGDALVFLDGCADGQVGADVLAALVVLAFPRYGGVEGEADEFDGVEGVHAGEDGFGFGALVLHVQLPAEDLPGLCVGDDLLGCHGRILGDDLHGAVFGAGLCDAPFAVLMGEARHGGGRDVEGEFDVVAEERCGCVAGCAVDEDARAEEDLAVYGAVESFGCEVVRGRVVVCPSLVWDVLRCYLFDLVDIEDALEIHWPIVLHLACFFGRLFFLGKRVGVDLAQFVFGFEVLLEHAWGMNRVVLFCCIAAGKLENDFAAARVFGDEARYIIDVAVENYPAALCCVMLCHCCVVNQSFRFVGMPSQTLRIVEHFGHFVQ